MLDGILLATSVWLAPIAPTTHYSAPLSISVPVGLDTWASPDVWSIPFYTAQASDPKKPILYNPYAWYGVSSGAWKRSGNTPAVEKTILSYTSPKFPYTGNVFSSISATSWVLPKSFNETKGTLQGPTSFSVNADAAPAPGPDGHLVVVQPNGKVLETYSTILLSTGQIVALSYSVSDPRSLGDGYQNGQTASMLPSYLGLIDDAEIKNNAIKHAMAITVPPTLLSAAIAYPAYAFDRNALTQSPRYSGSLPMGARLALPRSLDINSLSLSTPEGIAIATAAKNYGFIIVDRGGGGVTIRVRKNSPTSDAALHHWNWGLQWDLNTILSKLERAG